MFKRTLKEFKLQLNTFPHSFIFKSSNRNYLQFPSHLSNTKMVCEVLFGFIFLQDAVLGS